MRTIADASKRSKDISKTAFAKEYPGITDFFFPKNSKGKTTIYENIHSDDFGSGYSGRTAIFEMIQITPTMEDLILKILHQKKFGMWLRKKEQ